MLRARGTWRNHSNSGYGARAMCATGSDSTFSLLSLSPQIPSPSAALFTVVSRVINTV